MTRIIVVSANQDEVTRTLHVYALDYAKSSPKTDTALLHDQPDDDVREAIAHPATKGIFVFLHGAKRPAGFVGQTGGLSFTRASARIFEGRVICGTCYSLGAFGDMVAANGGAIVGYRDELMVPLNPRRAAEMRKAALAAHRVLRDNGNVEEAVEVARREYLAAADLWMREGTIDGQVHAAAVGHTNSERIGAKGNIRATIGARRSGLRKGRRMEKGHDTAK